MAIVEAIRWVRPLSPPDLAAVLDDLDVRLASVRYHATVLVGEEVLTEIGRRPAGVSVEVVYALAYAR